MTTAMKAMLAAAVWASGVAAVGGLAYTYGGAPEAAVTSAAHHAVKKTMAPRPALARLGADVVRMPAFEIVGHRPTPPKAAVTEAPRDISQMTCSNWHDLEQGSNSVRVCE